MNKIYKLILKSCQNTRRLLLLSLIFNIVLTTIFLMLGTGIENVTNESLSKNDYNQLMAMISSIIFVSLISIVFLQWLTSLIVKTIIDNRKIDTVNFQLIGIAKNTLVSLYFKEIFVTQIIGAIIGLPLSVFAFNILSKIFELEINTIALSKLIASFAIYIISTSIISIITIVLNIKVNPISELRSNSTNITSSNYLFKYRSLIYRVFGVFIAIVSLYLFITSSDEKVKWLFSLLIFPSVFFLFDDILNIIGNIVLKITNTLSNKELYLAEKLSMAHAKKTRISLIILVFSCSFYLGLYTCFETIRESGTLSAENNIKYNSRYIYDDFITKDKSLNKNIYFGLRFKTKTPSNSIIYVNGIDEKYVYDYENIKFDNDYSSEQEISSILRDLNNADYNGIIMPNMFITEDDVGKELILIINDKPIKFIVSGACYVNNLGRNNTYVSQNYLRKVLDLPIENNVIYNLEESSIENIINKNQNFILRTTKNDIVVESYTRSVHGTELPEITAFLVLFCSILIINNNIFINSKTDLHDVSNFRALGCTSSKIYYLYLGQNYLNIIKASFLIFPLSAVLSITAINLVLKSGYIVNGIVIPWARISFVIFAILISITISISLMIKKCDNSKLNLLLRSQ